jgi:hypothetical protein
MRERNLMAKGMNYDHAHDISVERELVPRARKFTVDMEGPLMLRPFRQSAGLCGPASLKIAFALFGRHYSEKELARLCRSTPEVGTQHRHLVRAAIGLGANVFVKRGGDLEEIRDIVHTDRMPVIVGWYSPTDPKKPLPDEDHFSVVAQVTDKRIVLCDPENDSGFNELSRRQFEKQWWDTDDEGHGRPVRRWYMALNVDGERIEIPGGKNFEPKI